MTDKPVLLVKHRPGVLEVMTTRRDRLRDKLRETRRRLGPYVALSSTCEPWRVNQTELARRLAEVVDVLDEVVASLDDRREG
jgi:hypothetical protein